MNFDCSIPWRSCHCVLILEKTWSKSFLHMSHDQTCLCYMRTTKTQISLRIRAVYSAPLMFAAWIVAISVIPRTLLASVTEQAGLSLTWSHITEGRIVHHSLDFIETTEYKELKYAKQISRLMTKPTKWHVHQPSLIRGFAVSMKKAWVLSYQLSASEDSDQNGRMPRLIWVFAGRTCYFVGFVTGWLKFKFWISI